MSYSDDEKVALLSQKIKNGVGPEAAENWFADIVVGVDEPKKEVTIFSPTNFHRDWIRNHFGGQIGDYVKEVFGMVWKVGFIMDQTQTSLMKAGATAYRNGRDAQRDFFIPSLTDVPGKDEVHLMEVAPFVLSTRDSRTSLVYDQLPDVAITVTGTEQYGIITYNDYSFFLMSVSHLNEQAEKWRRDMKIWRDSGEKGEKPKKPPRKYRPLTKDYEKFLGKRLGGKQLEDIEPMLDRLSNTSAKVTRTGRAYKRVGSFHFIQQYDVVSYTNEGKFVREVEITYPEWVYEGVVKEGSPTLKTYHPEYLDISSSLGGFLYRLAKIKAEKGEHDMPLKEVHHRSGSVQTLSEFTKTLLRYLDRLKQGRDHMPEYEFAVIGEKRSKKLRMVFVGNRQEYIAG
jgi:hypothetical protein